MQDHLSEESQVDTYWTEFEDSFTPKRLKTKKLKEHKRMGRMS